MHWMARMTALVAIAIFGGIAFVHTIALIGSNGQRGNGIWVGLGLAIALAGIWLYRAAASGEQARDDDLIVQARRRGRLTASARGVMQSLAFATVLAALGFGAMLAQQKGHWVVATAAVSGLVAWLALGVDLLRLVLRPGPMLVLDTHGIAYAAYGRIPWADVVSLHLRQVRVRGATQHSLHLQVRDPLRYIDDAPWLMRLGKRGWRRSPPATGELVVALNLLNRPARVIHAVAQSFHARAQPAATKPDTPDAFDDLFPEGMRAPGAIANATPAQLEAWTRELRERIGGPGSGSGTRRYVPNRIPVGERRVSLVFATLLLLYGGWGVGVNDLYLPGRRGNGVHLHDEAAWIMCAAMVCASAVLLSVVADHYDPRDNERHYRRFATVFRWLGWGCFGASLLWKLLGR